MSDDTIHDAILHVYSPQAWHDTAFLVGTREAFVRLADACHVALDQGEAVPLMFTDDGEGYLLRLLCVDAEDLSGYVLPYTDATAQDRTPESCPEWPKRPGARREEETYEA